MITNCGKLFISGIMGWARLYYTNICQYLHTVMDWSYSQCSTMAEKDVSNFIPHMVFCQLSAPIYHWCLQLLISQAGSLIFCSLHIHYQPFSSSSFYVFLASGSTASDRMNFCGSAVLFLSLKFGSCSGPVRGLPALDGVAVSTHAFAVSLSDGSWLDRLGLLQLAWGLDVYCCGHSLHKYFRSIFLYFYHSH